MHSSEFCKHVSPLRRRSSRKKPHRQASRPLPLSPLRAGSDPALPLYACEHRWLDNSSVISDSMRHKPKGIPSRASTQPIEIQEEGIPLWPNKGVLIALPQEPSFGRFFAGFGHAWLSSPRRPSSSYRFFEAFRPNRRSHNPPLQTVLSGHRKARRRQLRQPNRWTKRSLWHGSLTAPRS